MDTYIVTTADYLLASPLFTEEDRWTITGYTYTMDSAIALDVYADEVDHLDVGAVQLWRITNDQPAELAQTCV